MPLIPIAAPAEPKDTLSLRLDQVLHEHLKAYADFIHGSKDYVIGQPLRQLFRKDKEFAAWLQTRAHAHTPVAVSTDANAQGIVDRRPGLAGNGEAPSIRTRTVGGI